ncbi:MAG: energy-coupling factor transporter transmembrane component T, partial [Oscillospiraceae bacterium]
SIGQYFPGKSVVHRLDPRVKIILTMVYIVMLFLIKSNSWFDAFAFIPTIIFLVVVMCVAKIPFKSIFRSVKPILPLILFTSVLNMFFVDGKMIFDWWIFHISVEGIRLAVIMSIRIVCLIIGASLLTYTTSPIALTDAIERLLKPLKYIKFPVHEMAMMMTIALRFIPTLIEETDKIMSAQKARGANLETGGLIKRAKALIPILIPLFVSAFRRAEELALAMECRCYRGGDGRTRMKQLKLSLIDLWGSLFVLIILTSIILLNIFL